jgi:hypothetical protein
VVGRKNYVVVVVVVVVVGLYTMIINIQEGRKEGRMGT